MLTCKLAPSVLSFDLTNLAQTVPILVNEGAHVVHLDVMDGQFVPPISFGAALAKSLRSHTNAPMEAHLMTLDPERQFDSFIEAGCSRIIFHAEATAHSHRLIQYLHSAGVQAGIAINPGTPIEPLLPVLEMLDMALVMTVNPGWGGQAFIPEMVKKVSEIRALRSDLEIEVDGGIDPQTLPLVRQAGANVFVVGSYLLRTPNLEENVRVIVDLCG